MVLSIAAVQGWRPEGEASGGSLSWDDLSSDAEDLGQGLPLNSDSDLEASGAGADAGDMSHPSGPNLEG